MWYCYSLQHSISEILFLFVLTKTKFHFYLFICVAFYEGVQFQLHLRSNLVCRIFAARTIYKTIFVYLNMYYYDHMKQNRCFVSRFFFRWFLLHSFSLCAHFCCMRVQFNEIRRALSISVFILRFFSLLLFVCRLQMVCVGMFIQWMLNTTALLYITLKCCINCCCCFSVCHSALTRDAPQAHLDPSKKIVTVCV